jgi:hypothetical protein
MHPSSDGRAGWRRRASHVRVDHPRTLLCAHRRCRERVHGHLPHGAELEHMHDWSAGRILEMGSVWMITPMVMTSNSEEQGKDEESRVS